MTPHSSHLFPFQKSIPFIYKHKPANNFSSPHFKIILFFLKIPYHEYISCLIYSINLVFKAKETAYFKNNFKMRGTLKFLKIERHSI